MNPIDAVKPWFSSRVTRWLERRMPAVQEITLHRKNIFILPTGPGLLFLTATALIFVTAINYVLSLAFGLAFLMVSLFILSILHTFRNLQHLSLRGAGAEPVFAGEDAEFVVLLGRQPSHEHEMLELRFPGCLWSQANVLDNEQERVKVFLPSTQRGVLKAPRLTVQTRFPLGLWRAWSHVDLAMSCLVYPCPLQGPLPGLVGGTTSGKTESVKTGVDDFHGLRAYQTGDSLKQIAWKSLARGQGLKVKQFVDAVDDQLMLDWEMFPGLDYEERLSRLCYWVLILAAQDIDYGLRIPGAELCLGRGDAHRNRLLSALALWQGGAL
tara:strand:- start:534 stop:1508 length:975 start_codon:yes stop_codon:yes gene_type:complete